MSLIYRLPVFVAVRKPSILRATHVTAEIMLHPRNTFRASQLPAEIMYHPPNILRSTQICIEVMYRPRAGGAFYTDQAAQSNFAG